MSDAEIFRKSALAFRADAMEHLHDVADHDRAGKHDLAERSQQLRMEALKVASVAAATARRIELTQPMAWQSTSQQRSILDRIGKLTELERKAIERMK